MLVATVVKERERMHDTIVEGHKKQCEARVKLNLRNQAHCMLLGEETLTGCMWISYINVQVINCITIEKT